MVLNCRCIQVWDLISHYDLKDLWYNPSPSPCFRTSYACTLARVLCPSLIYGIRKLQATSPPRAIVYSIVGGAPEGGASRAKGKKEGRCCHSGMKVCKTRWWHSEGAEQFGNLDARRQKTSNSGLTQRFKVPSFCRDFAQRESKTQTGEFIYLLMSLNSMGQAYVKYYIEAKIE